jgi:16S rRNA A1518/A1519 N6-dimethyltransferase RsmA/KsgA/DIM1 with predicted DNA glycosylase/AP lyase activity
VYAVEKDPVFVEKLHRKTEHIKNIQVVQKDFLDFSLPREPYGEIANIS